MPQDTAIAHFVCDRYDHELRTKRTKKLERQSKMSSKHQKIFDIKANLVTLAFKDCVGQSLNKAHILKFLSKSWSEPDSWGNMQLILLGAFDEETIDVTDFTVIDFTVWLTYAPLNSCLGH